MEKERSGSKEYKRLLALLSAADADMSDEADAEGKDDVRVPDETDETEDAPPPPVLVLLELTTVGLGLEKMVSKVLLDSLDKTLMRRCDSDREDSNMLRFFLAVSNCCVDCPR